MRLLTRAACACSCCPTLVLSPSPSPSLSYGCSFFSSLPPLSSLKHNILCFFFSFLCARARAVRHSAPEELSSHLEAIAAGLVVLLCEEDHPTRVELAQLFGVLCEFGNMALEVQSMPFDIGRLLRFFSFCLLVLAVALL